MVLAGSMPPLLGGGGGGHHSLGNSGGGCFTARSTIGGTAATAGMLGDIDCGGVCPTCFSNTAILRADLESSRRERRVLFERNQQLLQECQQQTQQLHTLKCQVREQETLQAEIAKLHEALQRAEAEARESRLQLSELNARLGGSEANRKGLEDHIRSLQRERDEYSSEAERLRREDAATRSEKWQKERQIDDLIEERDRHRDEEKRLGAEVRRLAEILAQFEGENVQLKDWAKEASNDVAAARAEAAKANALNSHLHWQLGEIDSRIAAQRQQAAHSDHRVAQLLGDRDRALEEEARHKEALLLRVSDLQEELGRARRTCANEFELNSLLRTRERDVRELEGRNLELERQVGRLRGELRAATM